MRRGLIKRKSKLKHVLQIKMREQSLGNEMQGTFR